MGLKDTLNNIRHANENAEKLKQAQHENGMLKVGVIGLGAATILSGIECIRIKRDLSRTKKEDKNRDDRITETSSKTAANTAAIEELKADLAKMGIIIPENNQSNNQNQSTDMDFSEV